jgi:hypothetical protein
MFSRDSNPRFQRPSDQGISFRPLGPAILSLIYVYFGNINHWVLGTYSKTVEISVGKPNVPTSFDVVIRILILQETSHCNTLYHWVSRNI